MATFLTSPMSPSPPPTIIFKHATHLSGATMLSYFKDSEAYLTTPTTPLEISRLHTNSKRTSCVSITRSGNRHSSSSVMEALQKIETELTAHRSIMLDIQSRISQLERSSPSRDTETPNNSLKMSNQSNSPTKRMSDIARESPQWWEVYPNYECPRSTPLNTKQLLKTPRRLSGFEFDFDALRTKLHIDAPTGTPEVDDVPALSPTSNTDGQSNSSQEDQAHSVYQLRFPTQNLGLTNGNDVNDIVEHIVNFDTTRLPTPPLIQSPPRSVRSKSASIIDEDDDITALPALPPPPTPTIQMQPRYSRRIINFFTCKGCVKSDAPKQDHHHRFMHFHRKPHVLK